MQGPPGKLPVVRAWVDRVYYEGEVVIRHGATWQASGDTGRAPPAQRLDMPAAAGEDGRSPTVREHLGRRMAVYSALDIVALNGGQFIARHDNPGPCPGDGWQLLASAGQARPARRARRPGDCRGLPGKDGALLPVPLALELDDTGLLTLTGTLDDWVPRHTSGRLFASRCCVAMTAFA